MAEFIFEIFSEEIPARMQLNAINDLQKKFEEKLQGLSIFYKSLHSYVTPRRMTICADGLSLTQEDSVQERKGPKVDAPQQALEGFLRSTGLRQEQLTQKSTPKGNFYFAIIRDKGKPTKEILKDITEEILQNFVWPKSMRWGTSQIKWVRPIQNIACVFGGEILPVEFGHIKANNITYGHRFMHRGEIKISNFASYKNDLRQASVALDHKARKEQILSEANLIANDNGLELIADDGLVNEVTGLVEWPVTMLGTIDKEFMTLPDEALIKTIKINQKYFCTQDKKGKLAPYFIFVSNMDSTDGGRAIIEGNQRVLKARLSDAVFFYNLDKKKGLKNFVPKLGDVIFHKKVGNVLERVERITKISEEIANKIDPNLKKKTIQAAELCKADLVSEMVNEIPDLQGIMGYYYALEAKFDVDVAEAIRDHYAPAGPNDRIPSEGVPSIIAIADKIDALASLFAAGERATGSKDPFALKRAALGIIRIIIENDIKLPLLPIIKKAIKLLPSHLLKNVNKDDLRDELNEFFCDRIKYQLKSSGNEANIISAVLSMDEDLDILSIKNKAYILGEFEKSDEGTAAIDAYKRASNILVIEEKKEGKNFSPKPNKAMLENKSEIALFDRLEKVKTSILTDLKKGEFAYPLDSLTKLTNSINNFYDNSQINTDDPKIRDNRLKLSSLVVSCFNVVADFESI